MFAKGLISFLLVNFLLLPALSRAEPAVLHHDLSLRLLPETQALEATDRLSVQTDGTPRLTFHLSPDAEVREVAVAGERVTFTFEDGHLLVELPAGLRAGQVPVEVSYGGRFADAAPQAPLNTEDPSYGVAATISPRGVFLGGGAGWYPEIEGSLPTFRVSVEGPAEMTAVTSGRLVETSPGRTIWQTGYPVPLVALAAGSYRLQQALAGEVPLYAYFYPQSAELAPAYLEAAGDYLRLYESLFGPYPFHKFAMVENFFPTGYGFPSWTLLGSSVVRLPFIVETSLGHEIAHSWWGTGVRVDYSRGNWSEGLTTYVADHLYQERKSPAEGREYRLKILRDYATLVPPEHDFPLSRFISRSSPAEQAVGYGKAAMVFHMARMEVGEERFWGGLRQAAREFLFRSASWSDFAAVLGSPDGRTDLAEFFRQWVEEPGAPVLSLEEVEEDKTGEGWRVTGVLRQQGKIYRLQVPLRLETSTGIEEVILTSFRERTPFAIESAGQPLRLLADPEISLFRRLDPSEIPPTVNSIRGSVDLLAIAAADLPQENIEAAALLLQAMGRQARVIPEQEATAADLRRHDLLFLGLPTRQELRPSLPGQIKIDPSGFSIKGKEYRGDGSVFFAALPHPADPKRVAALYLPGSPQAAMVAARKIPHYGKYSYLAFVDGQNMEKGTWTITDSPVVHRFAAHSK